LRRLSEKPFDPPALKTAASDPNAPKAIKFLIENGKVIEINSDVILSIAGYEDMKSLIVAFLREKPTGATASELRMKLQTSRRILIPVLEYLDRKKVTRRQGDLRILAH
jgi:selenocysteine-specific elongation factor